MKKLNFIIILLMVSSKAFCQTIEELAPYRIPVHRTYEEYKKYIGKTVSFFPIKNGKNNMVVNRLGNSYRELKIENISKTILQQSKAIKTNWEFDTPGPDLCLTIYVGDSSIWAPKFNKLKSKREVSIYDVPLYNLLLKKDYKLSKVEKPDNPEIQFGAIKHIADSLTKNSYEDNTIDITLSATNYGLNINLKNKSQHSLKILWDEGAYVDENDYTSGIAHKDVKFIDREKKQTPTTIIRGAELDDIVIPIRNVYWDNLLNKWCIKSLDPKLKWNETRQVKLMLPIQIKGVTNEYVFVFDMFLNKIKAVDD